MSRFLTLIFAAILATATSPAHAAGKKVIIGFKKHPDLSAIEKTDKIHRGGGKIKRSHKHLNSIAAELPENEIETLKNDPSVAYVEEDRIITVAEPVNASGVLSQEYIDSWGVARIGADKVAATGNKGTGVKIAILDSGIDYTHPELVDNYAGGYNFAYVNNDPFDDSTGAGATAGHGTHVAGIIAARDNGTGVVGVAPEASLYAVKVLNGGMSGALSDIIAGIDWSIENKMQVINMSLDSPQFSQSLKDACDRAALAGIILVAAGGNTNTLGVNYPAAYDSVIAVTATKPDDSRPLFNYGPEIELAAPGYSIKSTVPGGGYSFMTGSSQAAPHVAGVVALLISSGIQDANGDGSLVDEVRRKLAETAVDLGDPGRDFQFGHGLVDAAKALGITPPPSPLAPKFTSVPPTSAKEGIQYEYIAAAADENGDSISYSLISAPVGMTIDPTGGSVKWLPTYKQSGSYSITVRATDVAGLSTDQNFTLTVADAKSRHKLIRTPGRIVADALQIPLEKGTYTISLINSGLKNVLVQAADSLHPRKQLSRSINFKHRSPQTAVIEYTINTPSTLIFFPGGKPGSYADIVIEQTS